MALDKARGKGGDPSLRMIGLGLSLGNVVVSPRDDEKQDVEDRTCLIPMASEWIFRDQVRVHFGYTPQPWKAESQDRHATNSKSTEDEGYLDTRDIENIGTMRSHKAVLLLEMRYVGSGGAVTIEKGG